MKELAKKILVGKAPTHILHDDIYYVGRDENGLERKRMLIPTKCRIKLLQIAHDNPKFGGHLGVKRTREKLADFYWPGIGKSVEEYVKSCPVCQHFKNPKGHRPDICRGCYNPYKYRPSLADFTSTSWEG